MKKYIYIALFLLTHLGLFAQMEDFVCSHAEEDDDFLNLRASDSQFSGNGRYFTPKGDLRALIICAGFGPQYDNSFSVGGWDATPGALPTYLLNKLTIYSDTIDFFTYANANHNTNVSRFYYEMSHHKFRFMADVYPQRITIDATDATSFANLNKRVIEKMRQEEPNFDWSRYDLRKNDPGFNEDASGYDPDGKPDFVIILYRYSNNMPNKPVAGMTGWQGSGGGYDAFNGIPSSFNYNGYTFSSSGFTQGTCIVSFYRLFIHEAAHGIFYCPHYSNANGIVGNYFYGNLGWGMMSLDLIAFPCALGWEKWFLNWIDGIKANGINADIKSASDLNVSGEYTLRDFLTTGDLLRIKIPNIQGERNQYLWLENHQGISIFNQRNVLNDGCGNPLPASPKGLVAYIESINDDRTTPGYSTTFSGGANGIKYLHPQGNFDYTFDTPYSTPCHAWNNQIYNLKEIEVNPISGQSRIERIRQDFDSSNVIDVGTGVNSAGVRNESASILLKDSIYTYDGWNTDITFSQGSRLSMSSNPCLVNVPKYNENTKKMAAFILNGISVKVLEYTNGNAKVKIAYNDVAIDNNIRYTGLIHLPDITQNTNPDIIIRPDVTLFIDKSGTPNRHTKTAAGDFINPTEFHCLENSFFKQEDNSVVEVKNGSTFIINGKYEIGQNAKLRIKSGSYLQIKPSANLQIKNYGEIIIENGGYICVESGANINLQNNSSIIFLKKGAILDANPALFTGQCLSTIPFTGSGNIIDSRFDVYAQKYLYPITLPDALGVFRASVNVADVNLDGKKEIFTATRKGTPSGYLIGLDYEGNELFDIDNNVTTYSGFAELGGNGWAIPTLADLKREGKYSVITPTRTGTFQLLCYSVEDTDSDSKPDLRWSVPLSNEYNAAAVASNIDNSADGSMEIVTLPISQSAIPIGIYSADGALLRTISPGVTSYYAYGSLSVADMDNDGDKEIILACNTGIYVWHHDGSNFISNKQPIYDNAGAGRFKFKSSTVVCDLDGDGNKDILTCAIRDTIPYEGKIYAVNKAGSLIGGWGTQTIPHGNDYFRLELSVGDLDNDGTLEVVACGVNTLKIWKNTGALKTSITLPESTYGCDAPILADVDGDADIEIIVASANTKNIYGYNHDGSKVLGFPLRTTDMSYSDFCIDDVDNDGQNELIAVTKNNTIQMWETNGLPSRIEWGRDRHDPLNTGEYYPTCEPVIVSVNTTWSSNHSICNDLIIRSGTLTINSACTATMSSDAMIILQSGSVLVVDGGKIMNANIKALPGSKVILKNNAYIKLRKNGEFSVHSRAEFENSYGTIETTR